MKLDSSLRSLNGWESKPTCALHTPMNCKSYWIQFIDCMLQPVLSCNKNKGIEFDFGFALPSRSILHCYSCNFSISEIEFRSFYFSQTERALNAWLLDKPVAVKTWSDVWKLQRLNGRDYHISRHLQEVQDADFVFIANEIFSSCKMKRAFGFP